MPAGTVKDRYRSARRKSKGGNGDGGDARSDYDRALEPRRAAKITRLEFEKFLIREFGMSKEKAQEVWKDLRRFIGAALEEGVAVNLTDVGTLEPYVKRATKYRHPGTGRVTKAPQRKHVRFVLSPALRERLHTA